MINWLAFISCVTFCLETKSNQKVQVGRILSTLYPTAGPVRRPPPHQCSIIGSSWSKKFLKSKPLKFPFPYLLRPKVRRGGARHRSHGQGAKLHFLLSLILMHRSPWYRFGWVRHFGHRFSKVENCIYRNGWENLIVLIVQSWWLNDMRLFLVSLFVLSQKVTKKDKSAESYPRSSPLLARSADFLRAGVL